MDFVGAAIGGKGPVVVVELVATDAAPIGTGIVEALTTANQIELVVLVIGAEGVRTDVLAVAIAVPVEQALVTTGMDPLTG